MDKQKLIEFQKTNYLPHGYPEVLEKAKPLFSQLFDELLALPNSATDAQKLACFEKCVLGLNHFEGEIETVEREVFCEALYTMGSFVGLDSDTEFVDDWREW